MAFASVGTLGTNSSASNNQSTLVLTTTAAAEVNNLVVVAVAVDNTQTTDGASTAVSGVADSGSNTWTRAIGWCNGGGGVAQAGADISIWYSVIRTQINSSGTITATFTANTTSDTTAIAAWEFTCAATTNSVSIAVEGTAGLVNNAANAGSLNVTTANIPCLRFRAIASESNATTALTASAGWTLIGVAAAGASVAAGMGVRGEFIISTATSAASAPTGGAGTVDHASAYVALKEVAAPTFGGNQEANLPIARAKVKKAAAFALIAGSLLHGSLAPPAAPVAPADAVNASAASTGLQFVKSRFYQGSAVGPLAPPGGNYTDAITEAAAATDAPAGDILALAGTVSASTSTGLRFGRTIFYTTAARGRLEPAVSTYADGVTEPAAATETSNGLAVFPRSIAEPTTAGDTVAGAGALVGAATEAAAAGDTAASAAVLGGGITEAAAAADAPAGDVPGAAVSATTGAAKSSGLRISRTRFYQGAARGPLTPPTAAVARDPALIDWYVQFKQPRPRKTVLVAFDRVFGVPVTVTSNDLVEAAAAADSVSASLAGEAVLNFLPGGARSSGLRFSRQRFYQGLARAPAFLAPVTYAGTVAEPAAATDTVAGGLIQRPAIVEPASATEIVSTGAGAAAGAIVETTSATDAVVGRGTFRHFIVETATATDVYSSTGNIKSVAIIEALTAAETVAARATYPNAIVEAASASDTLTGLARRLGAIAEAAAAADVVATGAVTFSYGVIEAASATATQSVGAFLAGSSISEPAAALDISSGARLVAAIVLEPLAAADVLTGEKAPPRQKPPSGGRPAKPDREPRANEADTGRRLNTADSGRRGSDGT